MDLLDQEHGNQRYDGNCKGQSNNAFREGQFLLCEIVVSVCVLMLIDFIDLCEQSIVRFCLVEHEDQVSDEENDGRGSRDLEGGSREIGDAGVIGEGVGEDSGDDEAHWDRSQYT